jgi:DNA polymerase I-like protein with 3'-5' exonuclease and polymerase domains
MVVIHRRLIKEGLYDYVKIINQVHDSIILDSPTEYIDKACRLVYDVFNELPKLISNYFGFEYNVPMTGECKYGDNWNSMVKWKP